MKPKLIIESHVPYIPDALNLHFDIQRLDPGEFTPAAVAAADAMIIRTRTRCNANLLSESKVRFIATATIGTDHIDIPWCAARGIKVASAPGCNAPAVAQYVMASLLTLFPNGLSGLTIAVVGVGHVGSIVADWAEQLGMRVLKCDPPRAAREPAFDSQPLEEILPLADIVTFHVPHTLSGEYPTHHIADANTFRLMRRGAVLINSARGPIVNTPDLIAAIESGKISRAVIDCWEGEPNISQRLLQLATIATPHIAGYSLNGKIRATSMAVNALCETFGIDYRMNPSIPSGPATRVTPTSIASSYAPLLDTSLLKNWHNQPSPSVDSFTSSSSATSVGSEIPSSSPTVASFPSPSSATSVDSEIPSSSPSVASFPSSSSATSVDSEIPSSSPSVASLTAVSSATLVEPDELTTSELAKFASHFETLRNNYPLRPEVPETE